ncbi:MAG: hypothetical protein ABH814_00435 [bacterium]
MEEAGKVAMYCANCDAKQKVLEGEVTCPVCGSLLDPAPDTEEVEPAEDHVLGLEIDEDDGTLGAED